MASDFNLSANLSVRKQAPLDDRLAKLTKADLINPDTWASDNGTYYVYDYMIVGTADGVFMLTDKSKVLEESAWERVGGAELTDEQISDIIGGALQDALSGYVQKEDGKGLSTNDYTDEDKAKLDGLDNYDDTLVNTRVGALERALETLTSQNLNTTIESFNEIVAFLANIEDTQTLEGIVNGINQAIANVQAAIPTKVSQLDNDSGFLTGQSLNMYSLKGDMGLNGAYAVYNQGVYVVDANWNIGCQMIVSGEVGIAIMVDKADFSTSGLGSVILIGSTEGVLLVSPSALSYDYNGSTKTITITSDVGWKIIIAESWVTSSVSTGSGNGSVSIIASANEGLDREQALIISATDNSISTSVAITQSGIREIYYTADGEEYLTADGVTYNCKKYGV